MCPRGRPRGKGRPQGLHLCFLKYPKTDLDKPKLPKVYEDSTLHGIINNES